MSRLTQLIKKNWQLLFVLMIGVLLRLPLLSGSFWLDEAAQALESARPLAQQLQLRDDFQPPLLHLLIHFEMSLSRSEWWLRTGAALIPGLITIWAIYQIGVKLFSKRTGFLAALLLATSSFHLFYSQELRPYSMPAMIACLSWLALLKVIELSNQPERVLSNRKYLHPATRWLVFFGLLTAAGIYTSYLYPFLFFAQLIYIWISKPKLRSRITVTSVIACATFLPWLPSFLGQLKAGQNLTTILPGWKQVVSFDQVKAILLIFGKFLFGVVSVKVNLILVLISLAIFCCLIWFLFQLVKPIKNRRQHTSNLMILLSWLVLPIFLAWLVSFWVPLLQPKRVLYCLPVFYLMIAWLIDEMWRQQKQLSQKAAAILLGSLLLLNFFSTMMYFTQPKYQREDWRSLHTFIITHYQDSSVATFAFPAPFAPWQWYDDGRFSTFATGELTTAMTDKIPNSKLLTEYHFVLVFDYLRDLTDPQNLLVKELQVYGYHEVDRITPQTPIGFVRIFARPQTVIGSIR